MKLRSLRTLITCLFISLFALTCTQCKNAEKQEQASKSKAFIYDFNTWTQQKLHASGVTFGNRLSKLMTGDSDDPSESQKKLAEIDAMLETKIKELNTTDLPKKESIQKYHEMAVGYLKWEKQSINTLFTELIVISLNRKNTTADRQNLVAEKIKSIQLEEEKWAKKLQAQSLKVSKELN